MFMHGQTPPPAALTQPWRLPPRGLAVFHGEHHAPRLSHYFMPRLALEGKRILFLDGANCADPRLMARLAERRGMPFAQFNQQIMLARAFTCFQLTELISRVPQFLAEFPAQVLMVTAFPELYFDEDVRPADANAAFQQALGRAIGVVVKGQGFGMPIISFFTQLAAWGRLNRRGVTSWDEQHGVVVTHNPIGAGRILGITFSIFALLVLIALGNAMGDPTGSAPGLNVMSY
jgi:hypothetical protein